MEFKLTDKLAEEFLTRLVRLLNDFYKNRVQEGFYSRAYHSFNFVKGNRLEHLDYFLDEYLPGKYLFYSINYKIKFLNSTSDEDDGDLAVLLPINAVNFLDLKVENLFDLPDIRKYFVRYMYKIFGENYKSALQHYIELCNAKEELNLKEKQKIAQNNVEYNNSFILDLDVKDEIFV